MSLEETINKLIKAVENSSNAKVSMMDDPVPVVLRGIKPCTKGNNGVPAGCSCVGVDCLKINCGGVEYHLSDSANANCGGCCWV